MKCLMSPKLSDVAYCRTHKIKDSRSFHVLSKKSVAWPLSKVKVKATSSKLISGKSLASWQIQRNRLKRQIYTRYLAYRGECKGRFIIQFKSPLCLLLGYAVRKTFLRNLS